MFIVAIENAGKAIINKLVGKPLKNYIWFLQLFKHPLPINNLFSNLTGFGF